MLGFGDDARVDDDVAGGHSDSMGLSLECCSSRLGWYSKIRVDVLSLGYEWVFEPDLYSMSGSKQQQRNEL
jgi:hypothetical protein